MIFRSRFPDITIPDLPLATFVLQHAERLADKPALIDGATGRTLTYGQLAEQVRRTAIGLTQHGFRKGDVFATACPSIPEFAIAFYGVAALGGATTMLNPLNTASEMKTQFVHAQARFVLTVPERFETVQLAVEGTSVEAIFVVGESESGLPFDSLLAQDGALPIVTINPSEDVVVLPYSSGTTGRPKGVMLTHRNLIAAALSWSTVSSLEASDINLTVFPCFHMVGVHGLNNFLSSGATLVTLPRYDFHSLLRLLQDYRATRVGVSPPVLLELSRNPVVDGYDLSRLKEIAWGAAPMSETVAQACRDRIGCKVKQGYGLTEATPAHRVPSKGEDRPGSTGPVAPNSESKVIDTISGIELGAGEIGEICVRGPQVMLGYLDEPEATARTIDGDGWLRTGDVGYLDEDGWITIVDRLKELIKYKAYQVAPAELEALLLTHPAISDVAVIPSPDETAGEVPKAFVVLRGEATADEIMAFVAARVAPYKKVRRVEFVEEIPKSQAGKILRRVLVERERAARLSPV